MLTQHSNLVRKNVYTKKKKKILVCFSVFLLRTAWELMVYLSLQLIQVRAFSKNVMFLWPAIYIRFQHP